jgi:hypothetical protein
MSPLPNCKRAAWRRKRNSLPTDMVTPLRTFAGTGIDYAEPLFVKVGKPLK